MLKKIAPKDVLELNNIMKIIKKISWQDLKEIGETYYV